MTAMRRKDTSQEAPAVVVGLRGARIAARLAERVRPGIKAAEALHFLFELSHQA